MSRLDDLEARIAKLEAAAGPAIEQRVARLEADLGFGPGITYAGMGTVTNLHCTRCGNDQSTESLARCKQEKCPLKNDR